MRHLTTPKHHCHFHLVPLFEELVGVFYLELEIVCFDTRPELHFLDLDMVLLLPCNTSLARLFVFELAVVHDSDYGRSRGWGYFDKIESQCFSRRDRFFHGEDSHLFAFSTDHTDRADPDLSIYADSLVVRADRSSLQLDDQKNKNGPADAGPFNERHARTP